MKISFTCRKEMEVREMKKTGCQHHACRTWKTHLYLDDSPTNKRKVRIHTSASILRREGSILAAVKTVSFPFEKASSFVAENDGSDVLSNGKRPGSLLCSH
jgi:ribosomal protein S4